MLLRQQQYAREAKRLLSDTSTYQKSDHNPFPTVVEELNYKLKLAKDENLLTNKEYNYLKTLEYNIPTFYIIPKIHKNLTEPPGRPIVSACQGPMELVGKYLDLMLKEMFIDLKSFVQDTQHVLAKLNGLGIHQQPDQILLVGIDVESLNGPDSGTLALEYFDMRRVTVKMRRRFYEPVPTKLDAPNNGSFATGGTFRRQSIVSA